MTGLVFFSLHVRGLSSVMFTTLFSGNWIPVVTVSTSYRLGQISENESPVGIFEEKGANHFF